MCGAWSHASGLRGASRGGVCCGAADTRLFLVQIGHLCTIASVLAVHVAVGTAEGDNVMIEAAAIIFLLAQVIFALVSIVYFVNIMRIMRDTLTRCGHDRIVYERELAARDHTFPCGTCTCSCAALMLLVTILQDDCGLHRDADDHHAILRELPRLQLKQQPLLDGTFERRKSDLLLGRSIAHNGAQSTWPSLASMSASVHTSCRPSRADLVDLVAAAPLVPLPAMHMARCMCTCNGRMSMSMCARAHPHPHLPINACTAASRIG